MHTIRLICFFDLLCLVSNVAKKQIPSRRYLRMSLYGNLLRLVKNRLSYRGLALFHVVEYRELLFCSEGIPIIDALVHVQCWSFYYNQRSYGEVTYVSCQVGPMRLLFYISSFMTKL